MNEGSEKVSIVVPTYNERENVRPLCDGIRTALASAWDYEVIIVDDNSPDGTSDAVREMASEDARIRLLQRPGKLGLGTAVADGFALADGDYWIMMDADLSHRPEELPKMLRALSDADIVVGSRYVDGGGVQNWPLWRQVVSRGASGMGRMIVGLSVRDLTSGFGGFRRRWMEPHAAQPESQGVQASAGDTGQEPGRSSAGDAHHLCGPAERQVQGFCGRGAHLPSPLLHPSEGVGQERVGNLTGLSHAAEFLSPPPLDVCLHCHSERSEESKGFDHSALWLTHTGFSASTCRL